MIWYLLYPFRGTTDPPVLQPNHPLHRAFSNHGSNVARHWLHWILACTAIAVFLCYPVFFLYEKPTAGFSKLPYHVWTSARRYTGEQNTRADVEIRQVWIHGSYMQALKPEVLEEALNVQDIILGDASRYQAAYTERQGGISLSQGFHSPLLFWNCSHDDLKNDHDLLRTINGQSQRRSVFNLTLRPSSVFAGKSFDRKKLKAADTLVITVFDKRETVLRKPWRERVEELQRNAPGRWSIYPEHVTDLRSQLYEFQFKPMSLRDDFFLLTAYGLMVIYVLGSFRKLRAVRSKFGLIITIIMEMVFSITGSFTVCGVLQIDLARVPQEVYPFVVLVIGLENRFRLINAVLTSPQAPIIQRMANVLGDVGHLSLAAAGQNLFLLWLCTKVVSPGVVAFCTFASIALIFDFLFHLTFFVAVLSVDVQRMDLQDSFERAAVNHDPGKESTLSRRFYWLDALWQGRLPVPSRIAGTAISTCFVLVLNTHFEESTLRALHQGLKSLFIKGERPFVGVGYESPPINQARTPVAWLRIQDYDTAKEVIEFVKPGADGLLARIYDPITIVLSGSDRGQVPKTRPIFSEIARLLDEHLYRLLLLLILGVAIVTLLMQYLLWNELPADEGDASIEDQDALSVRNVPRAHRLDVVKLAGSPRGHIVAVGLDRSISIAQFDATTDRYSLNVLYGASMTPPLWPVNLIAIDDDGTWAALLADDGNIAFWNLSDRRLSHRAIIDLRQLLPVAISLIPSSAEENNRLRLLIATTQDMVLEFDVMSCTIVNTFQFSHASTKATLMRSKSASGILALSRSSGDLQSLQFQNGNWGTERPQTVVISNIAIVKDDKVRALSATPSLGLLALVRSKAVELVNTDTKKVIHTLQMPSVKGSTFRIVSSRRQECPSCHGVAVQTISFAYVHAGDRFCWFRTWQIAPAGAGGRKPQLICLRQTNDECQSLERAYETVHRIEDPGMWEATEVGAIIGVRKHPRPVKPDSRTSGSEIGQFSLSSTTLTHRRSVSRTLQADYKGETSMADNADWEAWTMFAHGEMYTEPLLPTTTNSLAPGYRENEYDLLVSNPGPITRLGKRSVAVGFGAVIKVIALGHERFETDKDEAADLGLFGSARRRRPATGKGRRCD